MYLVTYWHCMWVVCLLSVSGLHVFGGVFQAKFEFHHEDYDKQLMRLLVCKDKTGLIVSNPAETMFLFVDRQHLEVGSFHLHTHPKWYMYVGLLRCFLHHRCIAYLQRLPL